MNNKNLNPLIFLGIPLIISLLTISIGFGALSTTLTINGNASFTPVSMIRVLSFEQDNLNGTRESSKNFTADSINTLIDFDDLNGTAIYDINITNLGQTDKVLSDISNEIFSNDEMEYQFIGLAVGDIIPAKGEINFKIKFKYKDGITVSDSGRLNVKIKFIFDDYKDDDIDDYVDNILFPTVFSQEGACTFNGPSMPITGDDCSKYFGSTYIDTGIELYNSENYQKDYEIGFTIIEYDGANQDTDQSVFVNTKKEIGSGKLSPGLVFRKKSNSDTELEIAQYIKVNATKIVPASGIKKVRIIRKNNIVYYSINDKELTVLQDMSDFNNPFSLSAWFGAVPDENGAVIRNLKATLSNMYIKLGVYQPVKHTVTFDANGGLLGSNTRQVVEYDKVGSLPVPTYNGYKIFEGWYTDTTYQVPVDENNVVYSDVTYYAKWSDIAIQINDKYYNTFKDAINDIDSSNGQVTIKLLTDISDSITIENDMDIILDLQNHTIANSTNLSTIINNGHLKIINGTVYTNSDNNATINNESTGILEINNTNVIAVGNKQCLYNNGGTVTISDKSYFNSLTEIRSAIHNLNNGSLIINDGTVISVGQAAINNTGTMTIGVKNGNTDVMTPLIQGKTYGIVSSSNFSFYNGVIKGQTASVNSITKIVNKEDNFSIKNDTEMIDEVEYKTIYLSL